MLAACGGEPDSGPVEVKWDRVTCERCRMVLSDRRHAVEVRLRRPGGRSKVLFFDDIGCALIWLERQPPEARESPSTEIRVNDWRSGEWIDARSAHYLTGQETPMQYGLGAQTEPADDALDYAAAKAHIFDVERRFNVHGAHPDAPSLGGSVQKGQ
jgi:copper chaperone NosL